MLIPIIIAITFFIIIIIALFIRVYITTNILISNNKKQLCFSISAVNKIIKFSQCIPLQKAKTHKSREVKASFEKMNIIIRKYLISIYGIKTMIEIFKKRYKFEELYLYSAIGSKDASATAILAGVLWSGAGFIDSLLSNEFNISKKDVVIVPEFNKEIFILELNCIISAKAVNIIHTILNCIHNAKKYKTREDEA